ncbi:MAG: hypothetical protein DRP08_03615 [Candidatus Aenigmatarchaeota archaeon]|nr:MAG: hypothetical protein DRP08_03615 [Candidatus Aenigmarchaeota archaeon]
MAVARPRKRKWIPKDLKEGAFTRWCKAQGYGGVTEVCIAKGLAAGGTIAKRASLARTFRRMAKKRKKGRT